MLSYCKRLGVPLEPPINSPSSNAQVADVVNYVRSHFGNQWKGSVTAGQVAALPHPGNGSGR
jgi:hypothetical protein